MRPQVAHVPGIDLTHDLFQKFQGGQLFLDWRRTTSEKEPLVHQHEPTGNRKLGFLFNQVLLS
jgi:hypothetical protein